MLLAFAASLAECVIITAVFQTINIRRQRTFMVCVFVTTLPLFILVHLWSPPNLGFLPRQLAERSRGVDLGVGVFLFAAAFFGVIMQIYTQAERGLSLRMLIDIGESPRGGATADELVSAYSHGRGIDWMYQKRLIGLRDLGLIHLAGGTVRNSGTGRRVAAMCAWVQAFLRFHFYP